MSFHEIRFPSDLSFGALGGPERRTHIVSLVSGHEERNSPWAHSRRRYDAGLGLRSLDDIDVLLAFFEARHGRLHGFRWKDWADYKSCAASAVVSASDQQIGLGDGATTDFQLIKTYVSGDSTYQRDISKPVLGSVLVSVDNVPVVEGADYAIDNSTGVVSFGNAPASGAVIAAGFEFDVPVRFDNDAILVSMETFQAGQVPDVPVVELRV